MTTTLVAPTELLQPIVGNQSHDLEMWKGKGAHLLRSLQETQNNFETNRWAIGDWLVDGENQFGELAYSEAEKMTGWERGSLYNIVWVVRKFPTPSLRSEASLKWSHFKELARIADEKVRLELLQGFNNGFEHSVLDVRSRVDAVLKGLRERNGSRKAKRSTTLVYMQVSLEPEQRELIKRLARAKGEAPDLFLRDIVLKYLQNDRRELLAKSQQSKKLRQSEKR